MNTKAKFDANDWFFLIALLVTITLFIYFIFTGRAFT